MTHARIGNLGKIGKVSGRLVAGHLAVLLLAVILTLPSGARAALEGPGPGPGPEPEPDDPCARLNCDDGNPCTVDACVSGGCRSTPLANGSPCDDGDECSLAEACQDGACVVTEAARDLTPCDDGKVCTLGEVCVGGQCTTPDPAPEPHPLDGFPCYTDPLQYCETAGICAGGECEPQTPEDGTPCNDGDKCTGDDQCIDGHCTGTPIWCPEAVPPFGHPQGDLPDPPEIVVPHLPPAWEIPPEDPFDENDPNQPSTRCSPGLGWSFNNGTFQGWSVFPISTGMRRPTFGNNVDINRIMPPGYANDAPNDPNTAIGGDYWRFSRDVNQKGLWWIGTSDNRQNPNELPGKRFNENLHVTITSPEFRIEAPYISFYIGGSRLTGERVELQVKANGLPQILNTQINRDGIGVTEFPKNHQWMPINDSGWSIVRSSANTQYRETSNPEYMERRVVWDVKAFPNYKARLRIVDMPTPVTSEEGHINVDHFLCLATPPEGTTWLAKPNGNKSAIGHVIEPVPLWGFTDSHAHVLSNLAFGGHFAWGDPSDDLADTYDCSTPLPEIKDLNGNVVRPAIPNPDLVTPCKVDFDLVLGVGAVAIGACQVLNIIPYIGGAAATACAAAIVATAAIIADQPILTAQFLHGSEIAIGGAVDASLWFDGFLSSVVKGAGKQIGFEEHINGVIEILDFDGPEGRHSKRGGSIHQNFQKDMILRAWQGGLRLIGLDTINGRLMQNLIDGEATYGDWQAVEDMVEGVKRLVADPNDPTYPVGPLNQIAAIAYSPGQAREIIRRNKIAIVLGTEVGELGKRRFDGDSPELQVQDLYDMGIRKITAIHGEDNPLGGSGVFNDIYPIANHFNNVTVDENGQADGQWEKALPGAVDFLLSPAFPIPFGFGLLGSWEPFQKLEAPIDPNAWNLENGGWFRVAESTPNDWIGGYDKITFRFGIESSKPLATLQSNGKWAKVDEYGSATFPGSGQLKQLLRAQSLGWMMADSNNIACTLEGALIPMEVGAQNDFTLKWPQEVINNYAAAEGGHFNAVGLREDGKQFLWKMMEQGMVIDLDHFSQKGRVDAYELVDSFGQTVADLEGNGDAVYVPGYPTFGVHVDVRGMSRHGPPVGIQSMMDTHGWGAETDRMPVEFEKVRKDGGALSPGANAGVFDPPPFQPVSNDCDYSSKPAALKYLQVSKLLKGRGVTMSADMGGPVKHAVPRYGDKACHLRTGPEKDGALVDNPTEPTGVVQWPRDWTTAMVALDCAANGERRADLWDPDCASTKSLAAQYNEATGVEYEDYEIRPQEVPDGVDGQPNTDGIKYVMARSAAEVRDDNAPRKKINEWVAIGNSRQMAPMKKMVPTVHGSWDINLDGLQHMGLYPDYIQDMRNIGVLWERLTPMFNAAEDYIRMWERQCRMANVYRSAEGQPPIACD